jgi:hypothetical protein
VISRHHRILHEKKTDSLEESDSPTGLFVCALRDRLLRSHDTLAAKPIDHRRA